MSRVGARIVNVIGNPKPLSRTYIAADRLVGELTGRGPDERIDLVDLGVDLLDWSSPRVAEKVELLTAADFAVIATPTYKASFTGLLKLFLDHIGAGALRSVTVVPLTLAADLRHAHVGEVHLKPVLTELGASCPTASCFLLESQFDAPGALDEWIERARRPLEHLW